jgi:hypothetical protein
MSVIFKDGQILFVSGQVAMGAACCCDDGPAPGSCPCGSWLPGSWPCGGLNETYRLTCDYEYWSNTDCTGSLLYTDHVNTIVTAFYDEFFLPSCTWVSGDGNQFLYLGDDGWHVQMFDGDAVKDTGDTPIGAYESLNCQPAYEGSEKLTNVVVSSV